MPRQKKYTNQRKRPVSRKLPSSLKHELRGHEIKVSPMPPPFTSRPWFSLTVRVVDIDANFSFRHLQNDFLSQLGFPSDLPIFIKIHSFKIWGPLVPFTSATPLQQISVAVRDYIATTVSASGSPVYENRVLEQFTRYPDLTRRASIGFIYPITHQNVVLTSHLEANNFNLLNATGLGPGSIAYFYIKWRTGVVNPASLEDGFERLDIHRS